MSTKLTIRPCATDTRVSASAVRWEVINLTTGNSFGYDQVARATVAGEWGRGLGVGADGNMIKAVDNRRAMTIWGAAQMAVSVARSAGDDIRVTSLVARVANSPELAVLQDALTAREGELSAARATERAALKALEAAQNRVAILRIADCVTTEEESLAGLSRDNAAREYVRCEDARKAAQAAVAAARKALNQGCTDFITGFLEFPWMICSNSERAEAQRALDAAGKAATVQALGAAGIKADK